MNDRERVELLVQQNAALAEMVRIFTVSLNTVHDKDDLNAGGRMMLASMGRATLTQWGKVELE